MMRQAAESLVLTGRLAIDPGITDLYISTVLSDGYFDGYGFGARILDGRELCGTNACIRPNQINKGRP